MGKPEQDWEEGEPCPQCGERALRFLEGVCRACYRDNVARGSRSVEREAQLEELRRALRARRRKRARG